MRYRIRKKFTHLYWNGAQFTSKDQALEMDILKAFENAYRMNIIEDARIHIIETIQ